MTVVDLRSALRGAGLSANGRRAELVERWREHCARDTAGAAAAHEGSRGGAGAPDDREARKRGIAEATPVEGLPRTRKRARVG